MVANGVRRRLRLIAVAVTTMMLTGCVGTQDTMAATSNLGDQLQTFAADAVRHLLAAWLF